MAKPIVPVDALLNVLGEFGHDALDTLEGQGFLRVMNVFEAKAVELAPVDTGNLEASTSVRVDRQGPSLVGTLEFNAPYAAIVHELPQDSRGPKTQAKRGNDLGLAGPKYVERPLRFFQEALTRDLGELLQRIWRGASRR